MAEGDQARLATGGAGCRTAGRDRGGGGAGRRMFRHGECAGSRSRASTRRQGPGVRGKRPVGRSVRSVRAAPRLGRQDDRRRHRSDQVGGRFRRAARRRPAAVPGGGVDAVRRRRPIAAGVDGVDPRRRRGRNPRRDRGRDRPRRRRHRRGPPARRQPYGRVEDLGARHVLPAEDDRGAAVRRDRSGAPGVDPVAPTRPARPRSATRCHLPDPVAGGAHRCHPERRRGIRRVRVQRTEVGLRPVCDARRAVRDRGPGAAAAGGVGPAEHAAHRRRGDAPHGVHPLRAVVGVGGRNRRSARARIDHRCRRGDGRRVAGGAAARPDAGTGAARRVRCPVGCARGDRRLPPVVDGCSTVRADPMRVFQGSA
jgi:hypothetical protein